jgi:FHA domain-containing protein
MTLKGWMLGKTNDTGSRNAPLRTPTAAGGAGSDPREPSFSVFGRRVATADEPVHLGPYAPLIGAIREELEQFVTNQLRLHLAIAERDRYVLASIEVECEGGDAERELLRRFVREFRPEQVKHYLAKEIIAGLRNASAIDLSQFAGLNAERDEALASRDEERYGDLITELASGAPRSVARPYRVTLVGRWSELAAATADERTAARDGPRTPLAARPITVDIEDARGARRVDLSVVSGHRYSVGKGEGCDIVVDGVYASRRHCELWFEKGAWWVADAASTNGIRVESADGATTRGQDDARTAARQPPIELTPGAWVVLAAHMRGEPKQYPRLSLCAVEPPAEAKPASAPKPVTLATPVTPIAPPRQRARGWTITARMASGMRSVEFGSDALPFRVGRSRNQALVIDWTHADVSGRHFEIVALDVAGAKVVVHGDNGVMVEGSSYGPGSEFVWKRGETLRIGASGTAPCELTLAGEA